MHKADYVSEASTRRACDQTSSGLHRRLRLFGSWSLRENLERLYNELLNKDWFSEPCWILEDYIATKDRMFCRLRGSGKVETYDGGEISPKPDSSSSDRTIAEYNRDIWKLK